MRSGARIARALPAEYSAHLARRVSDHRVLGRAGGNLVVFPVEHRRVEHARGRDVFRREVEPDELAGQRRARSSVGTERPCVRDRAQQEAEDGGGNASHAMHATPTAPRLRWHQGAIHYEKGACLVDKALDGTGGGALRSRPPDAASALATSPLTLRRPWADSRSSRRDPWRLRELPHSRRER